MIKETPSKSFSIAEPETDGILNAILQYLVIAVVIFIFPVCLLFLKMAFILGGLLNYFGITGNADNAGFLIMFALWLLISFPVYWRFKQKGILVKVEIDRDAVTFFTTDKVFGNKRSKNIPIEKLRIFHVINSAKDSAYEEYLTFHYKNLVFRMNKDSSSWAKEINQWTEMVSVLEKLPVYERKLMTQAEYITVINKFRKMS